MKRLKKLATLILAICLIVPCFSMLTYAANEIQFDDPAAKVGETLEFKGVIKSSGSIGDRTVEMTYDTSKLSFVSGDHVTEKESGKLTYEVKGETGGTRVEFLMKFEALAEGETTLKAESCTIKSASGSALTYTLGTATITINAGNENAEDSDDTKTTTDEPSVDSGSESSKTVVVGEKNYTICDNIPGDEIPEGYLMATLEIDGNQHRIVEHEKTGVRLAYLEDEKGEGKFFLYVDEDASFAPFHQVQISDTTVIILLSNVENITMPEPYILDTNPVGEDEIPVWRSTEDKDICILYALDGEGQKAFYKYDGKEGTYQRFEIPTVENSETDDLTKGKLETLFGDKLNYVIYAVGAILILFVIVIVVLGVKLFNRNAELDELYDEFGIAVDDEDDDDYGESGEFVMIDEEEEFEQEESSDETEDDIQISDIAINVEEEEPVEIVEKEDTAIVEVEEDVFLDQFGEETSAEEKDEAELDFTILFADEAEQSEAKRDTQDVERFFEENDDFDFELDFLDLDD